MLNKKLINIIISIFISIVLLLWFGFGMRLIQGMIFCFLLLFASNSDIRRREVPDYIPVMIAITACIGVHFSELSNMFLATVLITLPQLAVAVLNPNSYGGADIKLMAACSFLLGLQKGLVAIIIGLSLGIICTVISRKIQKKSIKDSFALVPYLAVGCIIAFLL